MPAPNDSFRFGRSLKPGDRMKVNTPGLPDLRFTFEALTDELSQPLAF
ncbi:hypothetical protein ACFQ4C_30410 [Larkinella insperata]|uniref:Uncharacterized protein n=1 Tax=Larkinella insperata TaxID=332158 RepID=A0ABW3QCE9_9BACT